MSCLAPAAEPFWSRGCVDVLLLLPLPLGGDMQLLCLSLLSRTVATLSLVVGILEIPITSAVVFPLLPPRLR